MQFPAPEMITDYDERDDHTHEEVLRSLRAGRKAALDGLASGKLRMTEELRASLAAIDETLANS